MFWFELCENSMKIKSCLRKKKEKELRCVAYLNACTDIKDAKRKREKK